MNSFFRFFCIILLSFIAFDTVEGQKISKEKFIETFESFFQEELNVVLIPAEVYDCGYPIYLESNDFNFDIGYKIGRECLVQYIEDVQFTDNGLKFLRKSETPIVNGCVTANSQYETSVHVGKFCQCLYQEYVKYEVGFEMIMDPEFLESTLSEEIATYCFSIHKK